MGVFSWLKQRLSGHNKSADLDEQVVEKNLKKTLSQALFIEPDNSKQAYDAAENIDDFIKFLK